MVRSRLCAVAVVLSWRYAASFVAPAPRAVARPRSIAVARPRSVAVLSMTAATASDDDAAPPRAATALAKFGRWRKRVGWRAVAAGAGVGLSLLWGARAAIGAFYGESFLAEAVGSLLRAGARRDALLLLTTFALAIPTLKSAGASPILGFLATGVALGPHGLGVISDLRTTEALAELGVVFFLFEMGLELSLERLSALKREILGLGVGQMAATTAALASLAGWCLRTGAGAPLDLGAQLVVGASLALSSSAFALQLLRDKDDLATAHGRAALGVLLLQDLAVVPLLVVIPLLASGGAGVGGGAVAGAVLGAAVKGLVSLAAVELIGKRAIDSLFYFAAQSRSQEAFLAVVLLTVLAMSATTEAVGLSATLGAFLAGVSLSETRYRYQVEADVAPFRGMLLGLFFVTVGFSIDPRLIVQKPLAVAAATGGLVATKAAVLAGLGLAFRVPASAALRAGLLLGPGGEFGFVAFGLATKFLVLDAATAEFLRTTTALSMALTPVLASAGERLQEPVNNWAAKLARRTRRERDDEAAVLASKQGDDLVVVCGYGRVGRVVCELLDAKLQRYVVFDLDPQKATDARARGLPVFFGDLGRQEVLEYFKVGAAKIVVVATQDRRATNRVVVALRRLYPDLEIIARAENRDHQRRLNKMLGVVAMVPALPEDSRFLTLPFGGAVLRALNYDQSDVDMLIEESRRSALGIMSGSTDTLVAEEQSSMLEQLGMNDGEAAVVDVGDEAEEEPKVAA